MGGRGLYDGPGPAVVRRSASLTLRQQENRAGLTLLSPTLVVVLAVIIVPVLWTVFIAFRDLRLRDIRDVGIFGADFTLENFAGVLSRGFLDALLTTVIYSVVGTTLVIGLGLAAALIVRAPFRGRTLVRASMLLPYVTPVVAVTFVWSVMLNPNLGILNAFGEDVLGWERAIPFLSERSSEVTILGLTFTVPTALITVIAFQAWRYFPFAFSSSSPACRPYPRISTRPRRWTARRRSSASGTSFCRSSRASSPCSPSCG